MSTFIGVEYASAAFRRYCKDVKTARAELDTEGLFEIDYTLYDDPDLGCSERETLRRYIYGLLTKVVVRKRRKNPPSALAR